jgi:hypothetical protein
MIDDFNVRWHGDDDPGHAHEAIVRFKRWDDLMGDFIPRFFDLRIERFVQGRLPANCWARCENRGTRLEIRAWFPNTGNWFDLDELVPEIERFTRTLLDEWEVLTRV